MNTNYFAVIPDHTPDTKPRNFSWSLCLYASLLVLPLVIGFNFYGLYTDRFYFFKVDNYILPLVAILHVVYLYAVRFKIREGEYPDLPLRNVEFGMYAVLAIYIFKCLDTYWILWSSDQFSPQLIPESFMPMGTLMLSLQILLVVLTLVTFYLRYQMVGSYTMDYLNENVDSLP